MAWRLASSPGNHQSYHKAALLDRTRLIQNIRLCIVLLNQIINRARNNETGTDSCHFRLTTQKVRSRIASEGIALGGAGEYVLPAPNSGEADDQASSARLRRSGLSIRLAWV